MADLDTLRRRGIPFRALVDGSGVAVSGTDTLAALRDEGMEPICEVDETGAGVVGSETAATLRNRGIPVFCEVLETGLSGSGHTLPQLRDRGIPGYCIVGLDGIAQSGTLTIAQLRERGIASFCPVDEDGLETGLGTARITLTGQSIAEQSANGTTVGTLATVNTTGTAAFTLTDTAGGRFSLTGNLLKVANGTLLDYETSQFHSITVSVTGVTPSIANRTFLILVTDVLEPVITLTGTTASEGASIGTTVGVLSLVNAYTGSPVYTLTDSAGGKFAISGSNLNTAALLDYETAASHSITVSVSGITPAAINATFSITVTDVTEPVIDLTGTTVNEDAAVNTVVGTLSLLNSYTGTPVYTLTDSAGGKFNISGASLRVNAALDYETATTHSVTVAVSGVTPAAANKPFTVVVLDVTESAGATFNPSDKGTLITLSGGNLTATGQGGFGSGSNTVRATVSKTTGKYFCKITIVEMPTNVVEIGICNAAKSLEANAIGSENAPAHGCGYISNGYIVYDNGTFGGFTYGPISTWVVGDVISMAVDLTAERIWFRRNSGNWNDNASADPATGTAGYDISGAIQGDAFFPAVAFITEAPGTGDVTADFSGTGAPSGFSPWGGSTVVTWNPADKDANISLDGTLLVATGAVAAFGEKHGVRGTLSRSTGKYFCKFVITEVAFQTFVGITTGSTPLTGGSGYPGANNYGVGYDSFGNVYRNDGTVITTQPTYTTGDAVSMAIDFSAGLIWVRVNSGNWNNSGTANPATGAGGATFTTGQEYFLCTSFNVATNNVGDTTLDVSGTGAPSGFGPWGGGGAVGTTKNIVTDYGAVAGATWRQTTISLPSGSNVLDVSEAMFASGDVGKDIVFPVPPFGNTFMTKIDTFVSATRVLLHDNAPFAFSSFVGILSWGTNNGKQTPPKGVDLIDGPFETFRKAYQGQSVTLTIPAGTYLIGSGNFGGLFDGIRNITVNATGATLCGNSFQIQASAQYEAAGHAARTVSVTAGATFVTLTTPSQVSRFVIGNYAMMSGFDMQNSGYPTNHSLFEYLKITAIDSDSGSPTYGKITFLTPLANSYLSTWPVYNAGYADFGGPATLYAMDPNFEHTCVVNGLTIAQQNQYGASGLDLTFNDCVFEGDGQIGPHMTMAKTLAFNNCTGLGQNIEVDKLCEKVTLTGCSFGGLYIQSSSINELILDNTDVQFTTMTPRNMVIRNGCTIGTLAPGPIVYGYTDVLDVRDSVVTNFGSPTYHGSGHEIRSGDGSGDGIQSDFSIEDGVITVPASMRVGGVAQWAIKGGRVYLFDANVGTLGLFTITGVSESAPGGDILVATTMTLDDWPSRSYPPGLGLWLYTHTAPDCTFVSSTGCNEAIMLSTFPAHTPLYSRYYRSFDASAVSTDYWQLYGRIKSVVVTVTTPYVGATATARAVLMFGNATVRMSDYADVIWNQTIDLKTSGTRTFDTVADPYPTAWVGSVGADALTGMPSAQWATSNFYVFMDARVAGTGPVFTVEIITDQGF